MVRKLLILAALAVMAGIASFWFLTTPQTVAASALPDHEPNLDNGRIMLIAGGCASCHAPSKEERTKLGGGARLLARFTRPIFHRTQATASAAGAKPTS